MFVPSAKFTLINTVILLFNLMKIGRVDLYKEVPKMAIFHCKMGGRLIHGKIQYKSEQNSVESSKGTSFKISVKE